MSSRSRAAKSGAKPDAENTDTVTVDDPFGVAEAVAVDQDAEDAAAAEARPVDAADPTGDGEPTVPAEGKDADDGSTLTGESAHDAAVASWRRNNPKADLEE